MISRRNLLISVPLLAIASSLYPHAAKSAPKADPWPHWQAHDPKNLAEIDFGDWDRLLQTYLTPSPTGINLFRYGAVSKADRAALDRLLTVLAGLPISTHNRTQQRAYWINLYNALTIQVVLNHFPVDSIMNINISPRFFSFGPWDKKLLQIEGEAISLNDIEHRILRPLWDDPRTHYVLNCASLGCPNLALSAYRAKDMEAKLDAAAQAYINHPRGVRFAGDDLIVSSIYEWFIADFGGDEAGVLAHLKQYADPALARRLNSHSQLDDTAYDWALNHTD